MAPIPSDRKGLTLKYSSGIAPLVTTKRYAELIDNYKKNGPSAFPHILDLGGMAIDTSRNRNKWRVPLEDLQAIADKLKGLPLMKDHDIDHVDSIIGKVEEAWVEPDKDDPTAGKVFWKGECSDESLIQKILLGYVKHNSIQIAVPRAYCDDCMSSQGKKEEEAAIDDLDLPCPRCGSLNMLIRGPLPLEQSLVAIPSYERADVTPFGFKASMDFALRARYEPKEAPKAVPKVAKVVRLDLTPLLFEAMNAVGMVTAEVAEMELRMAKMALEGYPEDRVEIYYSQKAKDPASDKPIEDMGMTPEQKALLHSVGQPQELGSACPDCGQEFGEERLALLDHMEKEHGYTIGETLETPDPFDQFDVSKWDEGKGGSLEDFPLVEKGGEKDKKEEGKCVCGHVRGYHQEDGCHAPTSYFPGAACSCTVYEEAGKKEEASEYVGMPCPECKIGEMVDDGKGGANCPNCGWPSDKKEEDKCIWCNPIGLNLRSIEATHEDCTCKEPCDESFCMAKA